MKMSAIIFLALCVAVMAHQHDQKEHRGWNIPFVHSHHGHHSHHHAGECFHQGHQLCRSEFAEGKVDGLHCMLEKKNELHAHCSSIMSEIETCIGDLDTHCSDTKDFASMVHCVQDNHAEFSTACKATHWFGFITKLDEKLVQRWTHHKASHQKEEKHEEEEEKEEDAEKSHDRLAHHDAEHPFVHKEGIHDACKLEVKVHCAIHVGKGHKISLGCLVEKHELLTGKCKAVIGELKPCWRHLRDMCPQEHHRMGKCLVDNKDKISAECKASPIFQHAEKVLAEISDMKEREEKHTSHPHSHMMRWKQCRKAVHKVCPHVKHHDFKAKMECALEHKEQLHEDCNEQIKDLETCAVDFKSLGRVCRNEPPASCLYRHRSSVSAACKNTHLAKWVLWRQQKTGISRGCKGMGRHSAIYGHSCMKSVRKHCVGQIRHGRKAVFKCLMENAKHLHGECAKHLADVNKCMPDLEKHCNKKSNHKHLIRTGQCMAMHHEELSQECRHTELFKKVHEHMMQRRNHLSVCFPEVKQFCHGKKHQHHHQLGKCLLHHRKELGPQCSELVDGMEACHHDLEHLCKHHKGGSPSKCLMHNLEKLSTQCRSTPLVARIEEFKAKMENTVHSAPHHNSLSQEDRERALEIMNAQLGLPSGGKGKGKCFWKLFGWIVFVGVLFTLAGCAIRYNCRKAPQYENMEPAEGKVIKTVDLPNLLVAKTVDLPSTAEKTEIALV